MSDDLDLYLSRSIKNLAARKPLPKEGKERLLRVAASPIPLHEQALRLPVFDFIIKYFAPQTHGYQFVSPMDKVIMRPYSQTEIGSWEFASSWRMAS